MNCPKCQKKMARGFCMVCGYIDEETKMKDHQINFEKSDLEKFLKNDYGTILYNQNRKIIFLLGPLYFAYLNHFYLSFVLGIADISIAYLIGSLYQNFFMMLLSFTINHFLCVMFANPFYLYLTKKKVKKIKKEYGEDYLKILQTKKSKNYFLPFLVLIVYFILFLFVLFVYKH